MTHLSDLMPLADLAQAITDGLVREQFSGDGQRILNYTERAVYAKAWDTVTRQTRGLIVDAAGTVVARPWPKFFNYGEHLANALDLTAEVEVTDKLDGSLGILHWDGDNAPRIATRGSFASEQALHATQLYRDRYRGTWLPGRDFTYLFEIVYPGNRIVLDYGDLDDLVLLGGVETATGRLFGPLGAEATGWPGPKAQVFHYATLAEALAAEPRPNAEGLVVRYITGPHAGTQVKIKQDDYVVLHRVITGMTARRLWERAAVWATIEVDGQLPAKRIAQSLRMSADDVAGIIAAGPDWLTEVKQIAPEEFTDWIDATTAALHDQAIEVVDLVEAEALGWDDCPSRADIARGIAGHPLRGLVFAALDRKPWRAQAWAAVRPDVERPYAAVSEDVA